MKKVRFCIITTQSKVVLETVKRTLNLLKELEIPAVGVIENMKAEQFSVKAQIKTFNILFWER